MGSIKNKKEISVKKNLADIPFALFFGWFYFTTVPPRENKPLL